MSKVFTITEGLENMGALRTGGQGSVYKGRRFGPIISAVKLLPTPVHTESADDKNFKSFQNEVEKLKKVNEEPNPNVVKILNSGITESGSFPFIEMEFIDGPDLEDLLKAPHDRIFSVKEVVRVADHLANALAHCHKVGVKHGDIKSNNVKYNVHTGNYVLLDFGLSAMSDEQRRTSIRHAGAIEFMAPEQSEGQLLFATDIYSYGVILFELLAGQVPFPLTDNGQKSRNEVLLGHLEMVLPDILELRAANMPAEWTEDKKWLEMQVPAWLLKVINNCLEKNPENRYADGMVLQEALLQSNVTGSGSTAVGSDNPALNNGNPAVSTLNTIADPVNSSLLQMENDRLQNLVLQYQEAAPTLPEKDADVIVIPKSVFYMLLIAVLLIIGLLSYFLIFSGKEQVAKKVVPTGTVSGIDSAANDGRRGYSWDKNKDSVTVDTVATEVPKPVQLKPVPPVDSNVMDVDTLLNF